MLVRATERGYYGNKRRDEGEEFGIADRSHFSARWMEPVGWEPSERDPLDHDGDGKKGGSAPKAEQKPAAKPAPEPLKASTETTVTPPQEPVKRTDPITGKDI